MKMKNMTLENIAKACNGEYIGDESLKSNIITGVEKDSRLIEDGFLYVPFAGARVDGHDFINQCFEKGAICSLRKRNLIMLTDHIFWLNQQHRLKGYC